MDLAEDITEPHAHDPYSDDSKAPFYRKPVGLRRAIKHAEKEEEGSKFSLEVISVISPNKEFYLHTEKNILILSPLIFFNISFLHANIT